MMRSANGAAFYSMLFSAAVSMAASLSAQEVVTFDQASRDVVDDWLIECIEGIDHAPGACQIYQRVLTQNPNVAAMVIAIAWSPSEEALRLQIVLPLGTDLRNQPFISINGQVAQTFPWSRCLSRGCMIEALLSPELVLRLTQGETAAITVVQPGGGAIEIPLSLTGLRPGLERIIPPDALDSLLTADDE